MNNNFDDLLGFVGMLKSNASLKSNTRVLKHMSNKSQATIPAALRQSFGFKAGAAVEFFEVGSFVGVRPV